MIVRSRGPQPRAQQGYAGLFVLLLVVVGVAALAFLVHTRIDTVEIQNERATRDALAAAKAALIAYAVYGSGPTGRPGELPCPDVTGPGGQPDGIAEASCATPQSLLGRLPWKTLGIPQLFDSAGEPLWYALSTAFAPVTVTPLPAQRINSDTRGDMTVRAPDGTAVLTDNAVAVVFAPGATRGSQNRGSSSAVPELVSCTYSGVSTLLTRAQCPANYLDATRGTDNAASAAGPFIAGSGTDAFNDKLAYVETAELIPFVEIRVANELKKLLTEYRVKSDCQCYPWADSWPYSEGIADIGQNRGRFPGLAFPEDWGALTLSGQRLPTLPAWFEANNWHNLTWYSVSRQASADPAGCRTCSSSATLSVGSVKVAALFFMPGTARDAQPRVPPTVLGSILTPAQRARADDLTLYLEDAQNNDGASASCPNSGEIRGIAGIGLLTGAASCDQYVTPTAPQRDRDRINLLGPAYPGTCERYGPELADAAPCGTAWTITNPTCIATMPLLDACSCAAAARVLARPPCSNVLNPPQCQAAIAQLRACSG